MAEGNVKHLFHDLKNIAAKIDKELPVLKTTLSQPKRPGLSGNSAISELQSIISQVNENKAVGKLELNEMKMSNSRMEKLIDFGVDRCTQVYVELENILQHLKKYGFKPEPAEFLKETTIPVISEPPPSAQKVTKDRSPDVTNIGLSTNAVGLLFSSQKLTIQQHKVKKILLKNDPPKFDLDASITEENIGACGDSTLIGCTNFHPKIEEDIINECPQINSTTPESPEFLRSGDQTTPTTTKPISDSQTPETPQLTVNFASLKNYLR